MYARFAVLGLLGLCFLTSCSTPNAQVMRAQKEKEQLTEVIRSQRDTNKALQERNDQLAKRVDEAEKELAIAQGRGTRLSKLESAPNPTSPSGSSSTPIREPAVKAQPLTTAKSTPDEKLPWRPARTGSRPASSNGSETR